MEAEPIRASLKFLANVDEPLVYIPSKGGGDETDHVGNFTMQEVRIHNGRNDKQSSSLDVEGFRLVSQRTEVDDFYDDLQVEPTYHEEVRTLLTEMMGAPVLPSTRPSKTLMLPWTHHRVRVSRPAVSCFSSWWPGAEWTRFARPDEPPTRVFSER